MPLTHPGKSSLLEAGGSSYFLTQVAGVSNSKSEIRNPKSEQSDAPQIVEVEHAQNGEVAVADH